MSGDDGMKTRPIHEIVTELLDGGYQPQNVVAWARIYKAGGTVPQDGIEPLAEAFRGFEQSYHDPLSDMSRETINAAIVAIEGQKKDRDASETDE